MSERLQDLSETGQSVWIDGRGVRVTPEGHPSSTAFELCTPAARKAPLGLGHLMKPRPIPVSTRNPGTSGEIRVGDAVCLVKMNATNACLTVTDHRQSPRGP